MLIDLPPQLSIIIPVSDDPGIIECVQSLTIPDELRIEVIIVLNGSNKAYSLSFKEKLESYSFVRIIETSKLSIPCARNIGVRNALAQKILMLDSDCRPTSREYISIVVKSLDHSEIVLGVVKFESSATSHISKAYAALRQLDYDLHQLNRIYTPNLAFQSSLYNKIGPYNESLVTGEDAEWGSRVLTAGFKARRIDATVVHWQNATLSRAIRTWFLYGRAKGVQTKSMNSNLIALLYDLKYIFAPLGNVFIKVGQYWTTIWLRIVLSLAFQAGFLTGFVSKLENNK